MRTSARWVRKLVGEGALELAPRRGQPPRDRVQLEVAGVLLLDDRDRLFEKGASSVDGSVSNCHSRALRLRE
jgi:hypothetical protein